MSQLSRGIFGTIAVSLTLGAVQLAAGRDLIRTRESAGPSEAVGTSGVVNRAAKANRADAALGSAAATQTISLRLDALADTSVLIRMPAAKASDKQPRNGSPASLLTKSGNRKAMVACEPPVSVLTEVAKQLQPGRCVT
jgi:hypothetical protein